MHLSVDTSPKTGLTMSSPQAFRIQLIAFYFTERD